MFTHLLKRGCAAKMFGCVDIFQQLSIDIAAWTTGQKHNTSLEHLQQIYVVLIVN